MTTILVAEDDELLLDAMVTLFKRQGYAVRAAATGNEAIAILQADPAIAVIISDYYMPDGDGRHLLSYVRAQYAAKPAFILVTGQTDLRIDNMKAMGIDEFLIKPYPIRELVALVARHVAAQATRSTHT